MDLGVVSTRAQDAVTFVAIGDAGERTPVLDEVAAGIGRWCAARGCDFGVLLGDNLYPRGPDGPDDPRMDEVMEPLRATGLRWYAVLGNHDYGDSTQESRAANELAWVARQSDVVLPAPTYTFAAGPARFAAIDTTDVFWYGEGAQGAFVDALPDDGRARVLLAHHPYLSDGPHGNAGAYEGSAWIPWASGRAVARFYEDHVCGRFPLALAGHDHVRERLTACGTTFVVSGAAAKPTRVVPRGNAPDVVTATAGFVGITIRGAEVTIAFPDANGRDAATETSP